MQFTLRTRQRQRRGKAVSQCCFGVRHEPQYTVLNQPLSCRKEVPPPHRPTSWRDWQMNLLAQSRGSVVTIQRIGSMKNQWPAPGCDILDGLSYPSLWSTWLNGRKSCGGFQEKEGRRGWQPQDRPSRCQQRLCPHRDIIQAAIHCLFPTDVQLQQDCGDGRQHRVLYKALRSGTASRIQHAAPLKGAVQITSHLKHISSPGHTLSFLIFSYLPISHANEKLLSKTVQAFTTPNFNTCSQQHKHRGVLRRDLLFLPLSFLRISASQRLLTNRIMICEKTPEV